MNNISGAIICGGLSKRMGIDKAILKIGNKTFMKRAIDILSALTDSIMIIGRDGRSNKNLCYYRDIFPEHGVMGGIHTALSYSSDDFVLCIPIDMPLLSGEILSILIKKNKGKFKMKVFSKDEKFEPLPGFYSKLILPDLEKILSQKKDDSMQRWIKSNKKYVFNIIEFESLPRKLQMEECFVNINYPSDLKKAGRYCRKVGK